MLLFVCISLQQLTRGTGVDILNLTLAVVYEAPERLHVHIFDTAKLQYQQPLDLIFTRASSDPKEVQGVTAEQSHLEFHYSDKGVFEWWITRKDASEAAPIFDTRGKKMPLHKEGLGKYADTERNTTAILSNAMGKYACFAAACREEIALIMAC